ncbi:flavonoid 3'-monooxygenase [Gracilaria domingensis]|nr:flavonoid 3'-monooxygenase [Gracilaria domingensis]
MATASGPDISGSTIKRFITAKQGNKERIAGLVGSFAVDPYVLQRVVHGVDGDYGNLSETTFVPRDFDLFVRCSTELGHRGDFVPVLFDRLSPGSALNATPERYGGCPFGDWNVYREQEPHVMSKDRYPEQIPIMERIIDDHMAQYVGKTEELGKILRLLVWNLYTYTSYGVEPSETTARMLQVFEDHSPEFDYVVRMTVNNVPYEWSPTLKAQVKEMADWSLSVTDERSKNIGACAHMNDVWTDTVINHSDVDLKKSEGALRGVYIGGMNNLHSAVSGAMMVNAQNDDKVYDYLMSDAESNVEHILREALRLYTSIPTSRVVREEDNFMVDGKRLATGTSVILSTYAIDTDPRSWEKPLEFDPTRFENMEEIGFLCQKGFAPLGVSANIGGRPCGARYLAAHIMRVLLTKLLKDYKFTAKSGGYFDFKQNAGTSVYAGKCYTKVEKR